MPVPRTSYVTHLEAAIDGTRFEPGQVLTVHEGRPLWVRYDLAGVKAAVGREDLAARPRTMWRLRELLPLPMDVEPVSLHEGETPLIRCERLGRAVGLPYLYIKDESRLPTGSFKSRGMAMAVSMAKWLGVERVAVPTAGNAGGALAAYAARAGMRCDVFMPEDTPVVNRYEAACHGAHCWLVNGLIHECGAIVGAGKPELGWFDMSTLKEPYRLEGKKTMGLELAEQFDWDLPDVVMYPTGGGTGLIGMWKAWSELGELEWLASENRPRMYACQSDGCPPIANAFEAGERFAEMPSNPHTLASGLRVPKAVGDFMILDAVRESGGRAAAADEDKLTWWMREACRLEGVSLCPESAACLDVLAREVREGRVGEGERVVVFNTGAVQKYVEAMESPLPRVEKDGAMDWARFASP